jgi:hypothetical protein
MRKRVSISHEKARWDTLGVFAREVCEVSDGSHYSRCRDEIRDSRGEPVVLETSGWLRRKYRFDNREPDLVLRLCSTRADVFQTEGWSASIKQSRSDPDMFVCGPWSFLFRPESGDVTFEVRDLTWTLRSIVMGYYVFDQWFPKGG